MSGALSVTEAQVFAAVRTFLATILPAGIDIIRAQDNRVPQPFGPDFVELTPFHSMRLATNVTTFADPGTPIGGTRMDRVNRQESIQIDVYGPNSADNAAIISTLWRSEVAVTGMSAGGLAVAPLYADDPRQSPFTDSEQQYEDRWIIEAVIQVNATVTTAQQFADTVTPGIIQIP